MSVGNKSSQNCHTAMALFRLGAFLTVLGGFWLGFIFFCWFCFALLLYHYQHYGKGITKTITLIESSFSDEWGWDNSRNHFLSPSQNEKGASESCRELRPGEGHGGLHSGEGQLPGDGAGMGFSCISISKVDIRALPWDLCGFGLSWCSWVMERRKNNVNELKITEEDTENITLLKISSTPETGPW